MIKEGQQAPEFELPSLDGGSVALKHYSTFVIDGRGVVQKVFPRVRVDGHAEQVLDALRELAGQSQA